MGGRATGWRLAAVALAWLAGIALQLHERELAAPGWYAAALIAGACAAGLCAMARHRAASVLLLAGMVAAGRGHAGRRAADRLAQALPAALEGVDVDILGVVATLPQRVPSGLRFRFEVEEARRNGEPVALPPIVAVGWYAGRDDDA